MSYGLQVENSSNILQIDSNYANYLLTYSGFVTPTNVFPVSQGFARFSYYQDITVNGNSPIIALRTPLGGMAAVFSTEETSPNVWRFRIISTISGRRVDYFIFDETFETSSSEAIWGLAVSNQNGDVVFDSGRKSLKVLDLISFYHDGGSFSFTPKSYPNVNIAVIQSRSLLRYIDHYIPAHNGGFHIYSVTSSYLNTTVDTVDFFEEEVWTVNYANKFNFNHTVIIPNAYYMVIDVTNL